VAVVGLLCTLATSAQALVTVDLLWTSTTGSGAGVGSDWIEADPGDTLYLGLFISVGAEGMNAYGVSTSFDFDLGDELDLLGVSPVLNPAFQFALPPGPTQESILAVQGGFIETIAAAALFGGFVGPGSFLAAEFHFEVTGNVATDGDDLQTYLAPADGFGDLAGIPIPTANIFLNAAHVDAISTPEPGATALFALGALGLAVARVRRR
jgi:hypothetical protein